ncbi:hypothetical protein ACFV1N_44275 [Streptosporangium canum]|uniref:hypothetical protein n=1 Tax=Streptosporangium canum TaxID=324952 RepID=UPI0036B491F8
MSAWRAARAAGAACSWPTPGAAARAWEVRSAEARLQRDILAGTARSEPVREVIRQTVVQTRPAPPPIAPSGAEQSAPAASTTASPTTAAGWMALLQELTEQLREGELGRQH